MRKERERENKKRTSSPHNQLKNKYTCKHTAILTLYCCSEYSSEYLFIQTEPNLSLMTLKIKMYTLY